MWHDNEPLSAKAIRFTNDGFAVFLFDHPPLISITPINLIIIGRNVSDNRGDRLFYPSGGYNLLTVPITLSQKQIAETGKVMGVQI